MSRIIKSNLNLSSFIKVLFLAFPIVLVSVKVMSNLILLLLVFIGIYKFLSNGINPFTDQKMYQISMLSVGYFFVILISIIINAGFSDEISHISRKLHFLLAPFIGVAIIGEKIKFESFLSSIKVALIIALIILLINLVYFFMLSPSSAPTPLYGSQITGPINTNIYGDIIVVMIFMSISRVFFESRQELYLTFFSVLSGLIVLYSTNSRGSLLVFGLLFVTFCFFIFRKFLSTYSTKRKILFFFLISLFGLFIAAPVLWKNINHTVTNIKEWNNGTKDYSSSGIRLEMWKSSYEAAKDMPWYGYGYRLANKKVANYSENFSNQISKFTHLHNEFVTNYMSGGIFGLLSALLLLIVPLKFFYSSRNNENAYSYSILGVFFVLGYFFAGMSHIIFGEEHIAAFFVYTIFYLYPKIKTSLIS